MRKLIILLLTISIIASCKNNNRPDKTDSNQDAGKGNDTVTRSSTDSTQDSIIVKAKNDTSTYHWTKKEQESFVKDCIRNSTGEVDGEKIKDFCNCMLIQSQKYYPSYREMEQKSNEEHDTEIFSNCLHNLPIDDEEGDQQ